MLKTNWHTHTARCGHASGTDEEYVIAAIKGGLKTLGFSDHAPYPGMHQPRGRMDYEELEEYRSSILALKEKYKDQITIFCGLEVEYYPEMWDSLTEYRNKFDYLILGQHTVSLEGTSIYEVTDPEDLKEYVNAIEAACEHGLCDYICHPDVVLWKYPRLDEHVKEAAERLAEISLKYNIPLEMNAGSGVKYGMRDYEDGTRYPYPTELFFRTFAEKGCPVIIGLDVHDPSLFCTDLYLDRIYSITRDLKCNILYDFDLVKAAEERRKKFY